MKVTGEHQFSAGRELLWKALQDPAVLSKIVPGFESLDLVGENEFEGKLKIKVGPVNGVFSGNVKLSDINEPESYTMTLSGKGAPGFVNGVGTLVLAESGDGTTLTYDFDLKVGGRVAGVGQRLLDSTSKVLSKQALDNLEKQVAARAKAEVEGGPVEEIAAPSQAEFAAKMAKGVAAEIVPSKMRPVIIAVAVAVVALIIWLIAR